MVSSRPQLLVTSNTVFSGMNRLYPMRSRVTSPSLPSIYSNVGVYLPSGKKSAALGFCLLLLSFAAARTQSHSLDSLWRHSASRNVTCTFLMGGEEHPRDSARDLSK